MKSATKLPLGMLIALMVYSAFVAVIVGTGVYWMIRAYGDDIDRRRAVEATATTTGYYPWLKRRSTPPGELQNSEPVRVDDHLFRVVEVRSDGTLVLEVDPPADVDELLDAALFDPPTAVFLERKEVTGMTAVIDVDSWDALLGGRVSVRLSGTVPAEVGDVLVIP